MNSFADVVRQASRKEMPKGDTDWLQDSPLEMDARWSSGASSPSSRINQKGPSFLFPPRQQVSLGVNPINGANPKVPTKCIQLFHPEQQQVGENSPSNLRSKLNTHIINQILKHNDRAREKEKDSPPISQSTTSNAQETTGISDCQSGHSDSTEDGKAGANKKRTSNQETHQHITSSRLGRLEAELAVFQTALTKIAESLDMFSDTMKKMFEDSKTTNDELRHQLKELRDNKMIREVKSNLTRSTMPVNEFLDVCSKYGYILVSDAVMKTFAVFGDLPSRARGAYQSENKSSRIVQNRGDSGHNRSITLPPQLNSAPAVCAKTSHVNSTRIAEVGSEDTDSSETSTFSTRENQGTEDSSTLEALKSCWTSEEMRRSLQYMQKKNRTNNGGSMDSILTGSPLDFTAILRTRKGCDQFQAIAGTKP